VYPDPERHTFGGWCTGVDFFPGGVRHPLPQRYVGTSRCFASTNRVQTTSSTTTAATRGMLLPARRLVDRPRFVATRRGEYFFLPGR